MTDRCLISTHMQDPQNAYSDTDTMHMQNIESNGIIINYKKNKIEKTITIIRGGSHGSKYHT